MENATKALLIAGTVLIAMIMISTAIYLYTLYSRQTNEYNETISAVELQKFNSKFESYIGRENITPQEIVTAVNLAKEYNGQVQIYVNNKMLNFSSSYTQEQFIKESQENGKSFYCKLSTSSSKPNPEYDDFGKVIKLKFAEN